MIHRSQVLSPQSQNNPHSQRENSNNLIHINRKPRVNYQGNLAYINISSEGQRLVGPLGLKKAEQELIKRRYKYQHYNNQDQISRVALVYGQGGSHGSIGRQNAAIHNHHLDPNLMHDHAAIGQLYPYQGGTGSYRNSNQMGGGYYYNNNGHQQSIASPYLQYTRDIQNLYRRQK